MAEHEEARLTGNDKANRDNGDSGAGGLGRELVEECLHESERAPNVLAEDEGGRGSDQNTKQRNDAEGRPSQHKVRRTTQSKDCSRKGTGQSDELGDDNVLGLG